MNHVAFPAFLRGGGAFRAFLLLLVGLMLLISSVAVAGVNGQGYAVYDFATPAAHDPPLVDVPPDFIGDNPDMYLAFRETCEQTRTWQSSSGERAPLGMIATPGHLAVSLGTPDHVPKSG